MATPHGSGIAGGHEHAPLEQRPPVGHCLKHAPQSLGSPVKSVQWPQQVWPAPQMTPQPPQLDGSEFAFTHWPPHSISGEVHGDVFGLQPEDVRRSARTAPAVVARRPRMRP